MGASYLIGGCVLRLAVDEDLVYGRQRITKAVDRHLAFEPVSVVLLVDSNAICAVGRLRRRPMSTTFERNVSIDLIAYEFGRVSIEDVAECVPPRFRAHTENALYRQGAIPAKTWAALREALGKVQPHMGEHIEYVEQKTSTRMPASRATRFSIPALEKDAVGLALSLSGVGLSPLDGWRLPEGPAPYLTGMSSARLIEDQLIQRDMLVFGDWGLRGFDPLGAARFTDGKHWLTVTNVNRTSIERTLGVDLIYYHHKYASYVVVQYKRFGREEAQERNRSKSTWVYRPSNDRNFVSELQRMRSLQSAQAAVAANPGEYRLNAGPCYVKLCEPDIRLDSPDLAKGMYLSLDYLDVLLGSPSLSGPRGGTIITYDTVHRHLTNSQFVDLVQAGWIGSFGVGTDRISEYITTALDANRSLILATGGRSE